METVSRSLRVAGRSVLFTRAMGISSSCRAVPGVPELKLKDPKESFQAADANLDGCLEAHELKALLNKQGCTITDAQMEALVSAMDANKDGKVSMEEFLSFLYPVGLEGDSGSDTRISECDMRELAAL